MISNSARWDDEGEEEDEVSAEGEEGGEMGWRNRLTSPNIVDESLCAWRKPVGSEVGEGAEGERR